MQRPELRRSGPVKQNHHCTSYFCIQVWSISALDPNSELTHDIKILDCAEFFRSLKQLAISNIDQVTWSISRCEDMFCVLCHPWGAPGGNSSGRPMLGKQNQLGLLSARTCKQSGYLVVQSQPDVEDTKLLIYTTQVVHAFTEYRAKTGFLSVTLARYFASLYSVLTNHIETLNDLKLF